MGIQLPLPAGWARGLGLISQEDPAEQLRRLERATADLKAEIRVLLDSFAIRHDVKPKDVSHAMDYVDDALADLIYEPRGELTREIERQQED